MSRSNGIHRHAVQEVIFAAFVESPDHRQAFLGKLTGDEFPEGADRKFWQILQGVAAEERTLGETFREHVLAKVRASADRNVSVINARVAALGMKPERFPSPDALLEALGAGAPEIDLLPEKKTPKPGPKAAPRKRRTKKQNSSVEGYRFGDDGIFREGEFPVQLTNWTGRIIQESVLDDGLEARREFELEVSIPGRGPRRFAVPAEKFDGLSWVASELGARAVVLPSKQAKEHTATAIKLLSGAVPEVRTFSHTGWRELGGRYVYLTASGGISEDGLDPSVRVDLQGGLEKYRWDSGTILEECGTLENQLNTDTYKSTVPHVPHVPPQNMSPHASGVRASLDLLTLGPAKVMAPLLGAAYRAPFGAADFCLWLWGDSGVFKSELATLAQQHYGPEWSSRGLPGSWTSTANALEASAFLAKDALMVVDDFVPRDSRDRDRLQAIAQRFIQNAIGNGTGRKRMRADRTLEDSKPARGMVLSTGEDLPQGQSLRGRLVDVEVSRGDVRPRDLTTAQKAGMDGLFAVAMQGFIQWLAPQIERIQAGWAWELAGVRDSMSIPLGHSRATSNIGQLYLGWRYFLRYAVEIGVLDEAGANRTLAEVCSGLLTVATSQAVRSSESDPVRLFLDCLKTAIRSGRAHFATQGRGEKPEESPESWGWRQREIENRDREKIGIWEPQGARVGFIGEKDERLILDEKEALAVVARIARENSQHFTISAEGLRKRLDEKGIAVRGEGRHICRRETVLGSRGRFLVLASGSLGGEEQDALQTPLGEDEALGWVDPKLHLTFDDGSKNSSPPGECGTSEPSGTETCNPLENKGGKMAHFPAGCGTPHSSSPEVGQLDPSATPDGDRDEAPKRARPEPGDREVLRSAIQDFTYQQIADSKTGSVGIGRLHERFLDAFRRTDMRPDKVTFKEVLEGFDGLVVRDGFVAFEVTKAKPEPEGKKPGWSMTIGVPNA